MVWLHGGGFSTGSCSGAIIGGTNLAERGGAVVVSLNVSIASTPLGGQR